VGMQCFDIGLFHLTGVQCQLDGEVAQRTVGFLEPGGAVVEYDFLSGGRIVGLQTEVPGMRERSVVAVVDVADDRCQ
jgi:hypothetical protein